MAKLEPYSPTPAARAGRIVMTVMPFAMGLACVLLAFVPFGRIFGSALTPAFPLMAIYYWAVVKPEMFPPVAVLAVGLMFDLLSGGAIGLWALVYVVTYAVVISQRMLLVNAPFSAFWIGFLATAVFAGFLAWVIVSVIHGIFVPPSSVVRHMAVTVAVFPIFAMLFGRIQTRVLQGG
ncbi:rod shape-determining protein MreD [Parvibaculum sp.]|jgi:rod shape-determining protein MreD|uniref:rod shape-determining protein MreD n=1 Tax=Parvibaculum sp. TaxID=2024848 RepID=UPI000C396153|nr:rod shape-determining protein MreD [Parvibaculum sp.]MAM94160.1 rod shape-determining protein MreD [Parvibaculum sp.]HCX68532.1 rod shape-determining protein MreD [Rhodobiaceae bacterium]